MPSLERTAQACALVVLAACKHEAVVPPEPVKPVPVAPLRGASGDSDLRVMLSELASSHACAMIRGGFQGLRSASRPQLVTGVLWIRECRITNTGKRVTFQISGNGWSWIDETQSKAGGTFSVRQYVRFGMAATIRGAVDLAYDQRTHVASLWFTPDKSPDVNFKPIGDLEVDSEGLWSSVVGTLGTAFATSPQEAALELAKTQGKRDLRSRLADGFAVTIDLCTGLRRTHLGRPPKGNMGGAGVGETRGVFVDLEPGGVILTGPQRADDGLSLRATASRGAARLSLVCASHSETIATAFLDDNPVPTVPALGSIDVRGQDTLAIGPTACPVVVVATPLDDKPATIAWERPTAEIAGSTGGPMIHCPSPR